MADLNMGEIQLINEARPITVEIFEKIISKRKILPGIMALAMLIEQALDCIGLDSDDEEILEGRRSTKEWIQDTAQDAWACLQEPTETLGCGMYVKVKPKKPKKSKRVAKKKKS